ncbi:MAG: NADH-quinone oxidoreductase subunit M [Isosphaeraceae bacterium]|nr:NADH-quinone oxidoreductase subunit M [Isosphaeraceae bacterium]
MSDNLLLSLIWAVPLAGALLVLLIPNRQGLAIKVASLVVTLITFALTLVALGVYVSAPSEGKAPMAVSLRERAEQNTLEVDPLTSAVTRAVDVPGDLVVRCAWVPYFHIQYFLGVDGISLSLLVLTGLIAVLACLASWNIEKQIKGYFSLYLLLTASMMGVFEALDLFLFYVFFEVMLLPMYFLIGIWGGENREYAAIKFLLYTLFGSVFILVAILILYFWVGTGSATAQYSFDAIQLGRVAAETDFYSPAIQRIVFILFLVGFLVKLPAFPFHTWLPDAHVQAPTPISMILAGILLKVGGYGLVRLAWPLAPVGAHDLAWYVAVLGVFSILYGALVAMAQTDFKKLVAYSSVSHMGYVTLGMAVMNLAHDPRYYAYGVNGAMYMMLAHGITSSGMFFLVGVIYDRIHTRDLKKLGGLFLPMPVYAAVSFLIFFGSMGLPGLCGFIAEVFVVLSAFNYSYVLSILAASAVILTAGYILWTLQRVFLGRTEQYRGLPDLTLREMIISAPLVVLTVLMGILPQSILSWMGPSVDATVRQVTAANQKPRPAAMAQADRVIPPPILRAR